MATAHALLIDVGGVLLLPSPVVVTEHLGEAGFLVRAGDVPRAAALAMVAWDSAVDAARSDAYRRAFLGALGVPEPITVDLVTALDELFDRADAWAPNPEPVSTIRALSEAGIPIAIVSNWDGTVAATLAALAICQIGVGPGAPVAAVIDSGAVGVAKPDPAIFHLALAALDVPPEAAIHVGDSLVADVAGARAAGIRPAHYDPHALCRVPDHAHVSAAGDVVALLEAGPAA